MRVDVLTTSAFSRTLYPHGHWLWAAGDELLLCGALLEIVVIAMLVALCLLTEYCIDD
ncbi:hypothetical protein SISNIDRAFT_451176 [Sistotremastrum niveocremeum HHB9708]|uniref:Uncharacterized protein n=2 Tax=Sistotremastraceae TaxID=3402574 RepID=A0A164XZV7_9AGAM|nr:hypothetical protein SISNIDRAFT_451176 [Sistotremastrum niveocremeum HHB9708]KZT38219.1 hypothetical protein SISSUDRAFT_1047303 [Sistotremastrum suecicum HHB10207 ss-3]